MNENKNLVAIAGLIVGALLSAAIFFKAPGQVNVENNIPSQSSGVFGGAMAGADLFSPYFSVNGVTNFYYKTAMAPATTTPCAFFNNNGTTTIERLLVNIPTATSSALTINIATSTSPNATSSPVTSFTLAANAKGTFQWSPGTLNTEPTIWPNTYFVVGVKGGTGAGGSVILAGASCSLISAGL